MPVSDWMNKDVVELEGDMAVFRWTRRPKGWASGYTLDRQHVEVLLDEENYKEAILEVRPNGGDLPVKLFWNIDSQSFDGITPDNKIISVPGKWSEI